METIEIEAFNGEANYAVVRLPARRFPGVVVQGDSLSAFVAHLRRGLAQLRQGAVSEGVDEVAGVLERLEQIQRSYEHVLADHSIPLPYLSE